MGDNTVYCVRVSEIQCDDFGIIYTFDSFDDAIEFVRLSLKNDYRCCIYTDIFEDEKE